MEEQAGDRRTADLRGRVGGGQRALPSTSCGGVKAAQIYRVALGEGHPDYAASLNNLAGLYYKMGRHAEAEPLYQRALEITRTALGEGHPDYAASLNNLAALYRAMGRPGEAEPLYQRALEIRRTALGEGAPRLRPVAE